jgi:hypothetical protein
MLSYLGNFIRIQKEIDDHDEKNHSDEKQIERIRLDHIKNREAEKGMSCFHFHTSRRQGENRSKQGKIFGNRFVLQERAREHQQYSPNCADNYCIHVLCCLISLFDDGEKLIG